MNWSCCLLSPTGSIQCGDYRQHTSQIVPFLQEAHFQCGDYRQHHTSHVVHFLLQALFSMVIVDNVGDWLRHRQGRCFRRHVLRNALLTALLCLMGVSMSIPQITQVLPLLSALPGFVLEETCICIKSSYI